MNKPLTGCLLFSLVLLAGCHSKKNRVITYTPQFPLSVTGTVTANHDDILWIETAFNHQVYEYVKCDGSPDLLAKDEGGSINFTFDEKADCYLEESATHNSDLDVK